MEYKPNKANLVVDVISRKAELAVVTQPTFLILDRIKEGSNKDAQAKYLVELAQQGKTRWF